VTFASKITIARICLVPVYVTLAFCYGYTVKSGLPIESLRWWALGVFVTAAATDGVDGWIARRFNQCSKFGAYIDPIADKALLLTGVITLSLVDWGAPGWRLPLWFAVIVVIRDCIILGGIKVLYRHHREVKIVPHWTGKICTVTQMFAIGWVRHCWDFHDLVKHCLHPTRAADFERCGKSLTQKASRLHDWLFEVITVRSIAVVIRLERTVLRYADVVGLCRSQLGELHTDLLEVETGHFFVKVLW
jgi:CDP-diacylglycerol--glycerol-3-phosphate 3-phosphatidyltransferase